MLINKGSFILLLALFTVSVSASNNLEKVSDEVCECFAEPYKEMEKSVEDIKAVIKSSDTAKIMEHQQKVIGLLQSATPCFKSLQKKYPEIDKDPKLQEQVMQIANEKCPNPVEELFKMPAAQPK
jgi:Mg2+ and Co2+ transporter CorA